MEKYKKKCCRCGSSIFVFKNVSKCLCDSCRNMSEKNKFIYKLGMIENVDYFECKICLFKGKSLVAHIMHRHKDISFDEYKKKYGVNIISIPHNAGKTKENYEPLRKMSESNTGKKWSEDSKNKLKKSIKDSNREEKTRKTKLLKYGNATYNNMNKNKQTKLERYGNENYINIEKANKTRLKRYGIINMFQNKNIIKKAQDTMFKKYGVKHGFQSGEIQQKAKKSSRCKWYSYHSKYAGDVKLQGTYELGFAKALDLFCDIKLHKTWSRNTNGYLYNNLDGSLHNCIPDFKVICNDNSEIFYDTKGEVTPHDFYKFGQLWILYGIKVFILEYHHLKDFARRHLKMDFKQLQKMEILV